MIFDQTKRFLTGPNFPIRKIHESRVIVDTEISRIISIDTHHMNVDYNAYEGKTVQDVLETVLSGGKVVIEDSDYVGAKGDGQFLKRGECVKI
jgi:dihydropyrimidinase